LIKNITTPFTKLGKNVLIRPNPEQPGVKKIRSLAADPDQSGAPQTLGEDISEQVLSSKRQKRHYQALGKDGRTSVQSIFNRGQFDD
jgi:hypothetical protein